MKETTLVFLLNDQNQVLLWMKKRGHGEGKRNGFWWKLINNETIFDAAIRELQEESGISIQPSDLTRWWVVYFVFPDSPEKDQKCAVFLGKYSGWFEESEEMSPMWWNIDEIPYDKMRDSDRVRLSKLLNWEAFEIKFKIDNNEKTIQE